MTLTENKKWMEKARQSFIKNGGQGTKGLVFGIGLNDADWVVQLEDKSGPKRKVVWRCPVYQHWMSMLRRVKMKKSASVSSEWKVFSNFYAWYSSQVLLYSNHEGLVVDKDLLVLGNTKYSKETCLLLPKDLNSAISLKSFGPLPLGVSYKLKNKKFVSQISCSVFGGKKHIGLFNNPLEAHIEYLKEKAFVFYTMSKSARYVNNEQLVKALKDCFVLINFCIDTNTVLKYEDLPSIKISAEKSGYHIFGHLHGSANRRLISFARQSAILEHGDQKYGDKGYIYHLDQVVDHLDKVNDFEDMDYDDIAKIYCTGYKHDEMEDCGTTREDLLGQGFCPKTVDAVVAMTKQEEESKQEYLERLMKNPWAKCVKKADSFANLLNSLKDGRVKGIKKYTHNLQILGGVEGVW